MRLTWRDAWATVLTAAVVALYWAAQAGVDLGFLTSVRGVAVVTILLGLTTCGVGSAPDVNGGAVPQRRPRQHGTGRSSGGLSLSYPPCLYAP